VIESSISRYDNLSSVLRLRLLRFAFAIFTRAASSWRGRRRGPLLVLFLFFSSPSLVLVFLTRILSHSAFGIFGRLTLEQHDRGITSNWTNWFVLVVLLFLRLHFFEVFRMIWIHVFDPGRMHGHSTGRFTFNNMMFRWRNFL
jgi:hypothetical protein